MKSDNEPHSLNLTVTELLLLNDVLSVTLETAVITRDLVLKNDVRILQNKVAATIISIFRKKDAQT